MASRTVRHLNSLARAATLAGAVLAVAVCAAWTWAPQSVDRVEAWLLQRQQQGWIDAFRDAATPTDPAERLRAFDQLAEQVPARGKLDRSLVLAQEVARQAAGLHLAAGDHEAAARHVRRLVAMDPRNVADAGFAIRVLGARTETRTEALERLRATVGAVPAAREVVCAGFELLAATGDLDGAARLAVAAWRQPASNRWQVTWSDAAMESAWLLPVRHGADGIEARFRVDREVRLLRIETPENAALEVAGAQLGLEGADGTVRWFGCEPAALTADGAGSAVLRVELPAVAAREAVFVFRATVRPLVARWLADLATGPLGSAVAEHAARSGGEPACAAFLALREACR